MHILKSFFLRFSQILSLTTGLCFLVMGITLGIQLNPDGMYLFSGLSVLAFIWVVAVHFIIHKVDPELVIETARFLYPGAGIVSLVISLSCMVWLDNLVDAEGLQHVPVIFVGIAVAVFMVIRCFDIKWMRNLEELSPPEK